MHILGMMMNEEYYDAELESFEEEMRRERELYAEMEAAAKLWRAKWPNHCKACGGWGGSYYPATGPSYSCGGEPGGFDCCDALPDDQCHRCGARDALELIQMHEDNLVCKACGWVCGEDGEPQI